MARAAKREAVEASEPAAPRAARALLGLIHVACPLLFFTNLTRNPYFTQIAMLNIGIAVCGILWAVDAFRKGECRIPTFPFGVPMLYFLGAALLSCMISLAVHAMVRPGLSFEMTRVWVFTLINSGVALFLPGAFTRPLGAEPEPRSIWVDLALVLIWGSMWFGFHEMKGTDNSQLIWDTYGGFLWLLAGIYAVVRTRKGDALSYFHVIFAVSVLAGGYGILQYWGRDIIWTSPVQPYGGRPVSTFGNPNFLSSYLMMVCPVAVTFSLRATKGQRWGYALVALVCGLGVLSTLTRSTYVGLGVALVVTAAAYYRFGDVKLSKPLLVSLAAFLALILLFPATPVMRAQSPLARFTEIFDAMKSGASYGPWHQRLLIWSSAWDMSRGGFFLFGRGWGAFELFFPFFQGKYLLVPLLAQWRTHANNAHNILLEFWSQTGILGTGLVLWGFVAMVVGAWIVARRSAGAARAATAALLGGIAGMVADNFFGNVSIFFAVPAFLFWWNVGALFNEEKPARAWTRPLSNSVGRPLVALFIAVCAFGGGYYFLRWEEEVNYFQGFKQAKMNDVTGSIKSLDAAYHWFPGDVNNNYELGNSRARWAKDLSDRGLPEDAKRENDRALAAYESSTRANPGYDEIYFNRAVSMAQVGQRDEAVPVLELALFINPVLKEAYGSLATIHLSKGRFADAADVLTRATQTFPDDKDFWNNLGYSYTKMGRHAEAFAAYKRAVIIDPNFARGWSNLAESAKATGQKDPILEVPDLVARLGTQLQAKNLQGALSTATRIEEILPNSPDSHLSLGNINFYLGKTDVAEAELSAALKINPNFAPAHANLGRLYALGKKFDLAREHLTRAVQLDPNDKDTKNALNSLPK